MNIVIMFPQRINYYVIISTSERTLWAWSGEAAHGASEFYSKDRKCLMLNCYSFYLIIFKQTPSNKKIEVMTVASNYHIEVNPNDAGIYDRIVIQEMIKNIAQAQQLDIGGQREFKGIFFTRFNICECS